MLNEQRLWEIGQRFVVGFRSRKVSKDFLEAVRRYRIGNVIYFSRNLEDADQIREISSQLTESIKSETGLEPWIMIDQEGGVVSRLPHDCPQAPSAMALAALDSEEACYQSSFETACALRGLGINVNLAPVLDVNSNPRNPVIGCRSFGDTPERVIRMARMAIKGYADGKVLSCGKHFPGHGDTSLDSHLKLPVVDKGREALELDLRPFKAAIEEGIPSIMSSHILFPALEKGNLPCTMSRAIIDGLLRKELGYDGLVFSDSMEMLAIADYYGITNGVIKSLDAGVDHVLISHTYQCATSAIRELRRSFGSLDMGIWDSCISRIVKAKEAFFKDAELVRPSPDAIAKLDSYAQDSIVLAEGRLPELVSEPVFIGPRAFVTSNVQDKISGMSFPKALSARLGGRAILISADPDEEEISRVLKRAVGPQVFIGTYNGHVHRSQLSLVKALESAGKQVVHVALRNPYDLEADIREKAQASLVTFEYSMRIFDMLADIFSARRQPKGRLPVRI